MVGGLELESSNEETSCFIERRSQVLSEDNTAHTHNMFVGRGSYMLQSGMLGPYSIIGRYCSISKDVFLGNSNHPITSLSTGMIPRGDNPTPVENEGQYTVLGSDVWVGVNSIILQGLKIGHGAVIGAGSVVTKDVPPYAIVAGNPARVIRYRFDEEIVKGLLETKWWMLPEEVIEKLPQDDVEACIGTIRVLRERMSN